MKSLYPPALVCWMLLTSVIIPAWAGGIQWDYPKHPVLPLQVSHPLRATVEGGSAVTFRIVGGPAALVNGSLVITNAGTVTVSAEVPGRVPPEKRVFNRVAVTARLLAEVPSEYEGWYARWNLVATDRLVLTQTRTSGVQIFDLSGDASIKPVGEIANRYFARFVQAQDSVAYVGQWVSDSFGVWGRGLATYDLSDPATPRLMGRIDSPQGPTVFSDIQVADSIAYVADGGNGLYLFDVSQPSRPRRLGRHPTPADFVRVSGQHAFVAAGAAGLEILDVSNPSAPSRVGGRDYLLNNMTAIDAREGMVFGADPHHGLQLIDVSMPSAPTPVGTYLAGSAAVQILANGPLLLVRTPRDGVHMVDISDPAAPVQVGQLDGQILGLAMTKTQPSRLLVQRTMATGTWLQVIQLETSIPQQILWEEEEPLTLKPGEPHRLAASASSGLPVTLSLVSGSATLRGDLLTTSGLGTVVVAAAQAGDGPISAARSLHVFNPGSVAGTTLGEFYGLTNALTTGEGVESEGYLYLISGTRPPFLEIVDVRDPEHLRAVASLDLGSDRVASILVRNGFAYLSIQYNFGSQTIVYLRIVDVRDPERPRVVAGVGRSDSDGRHPLSAGAMALVDSRMFQSLGSEVAVWNVANRSIPEYLGQVPMEGEVVGFETKGEHVVALIGGDSSAWWYHKAKLEIVDVADLNHVSRLGELVLPDGPRFLRVFDHLAVVGHDTHITLVDIADSNHPRILSRVHGLRGPQGVERYGQFLIFSQGKDFELLDISNPERPRHSGFLEGTAEFARMRVAGNDAFLFGGRAANDIRLLSLRTGIKQGLAWILPDGPWVPVNEPQSLKAASTSGLPVTFRVLSGPGSIEDGKLAATHLDTSVVVAAEQPGNLDFLPVQITRTFNAQSVELHPLGRYRSPGKVESVRIAGDYAYLASRTAGLEVIQINPPDVPEVRARISWESDAIAVRLDGNLASVNDGNSIRLVDISLPSQARELGRFGYGSLYAHDTMDGHVVFLNEGFHLAVVSDPTNPRLLEDSLRIGGVYQVTSSGSLTYLLGWSGVVILDLRSPTHPERKGAYPTPYSMSALAVADNRLYLAGYGNPLEIVDVTLPSQPKRLGTLPFTNGLSVNAISVEGHLVFVASGDAGVQVVDVRDPAQPRWVGSLGSVSNARDVQAANGRLYVAEGNDGLGIYEIRQGIRVPTSNFLLPRLEAGAAAPLFGGHPEGMPVTHRVVSGPGIIQDGQLIATGVGEIVIDVLAPPSQHFLPVEFRQTISAYGVILRAAGAENTRPPTLTWTRPSDVLEYSEKVGGPWEPLPEARSPYPVMTQDPARFFRLRRP